MAFSHGRGSNGLYYAWFGQYLVARGYIVAMINHCRANSFDGTVAYYYSKLRQRPRDISMIITALLEDPMAGPHLDPRGSASPAIRRAASPRSGSAVL